MWNSRPCESGHSLGVKLFAAYKPDKLSLLTHIPLVLRRLTRSSLVQIMACRLFGAKPLPEPMVVYCQLDSWEQVSVKFESKFYHLHLIKCIWKGRLPKWRPFCPGVDESIKVYWYNDNTKSVCISRIHYENAASLLLQHDNVSPSVTESWSGWPKIFTHKGVNHSVKISRIR